MGKDYSRKGASRPSRTTQQVPAEQIRAKFGGAINAQLDQFAEWLKRECVRPAAYAGAHVLYDEIRIRVPVDSGKLKNAIYHWHDKKHSSDAKGEHHYAIGVNKREASHWYNVEYGHWRYNVKINGIWRKSKDPKRPNEKVTPPGSADFSRVHTLPGAVRAPQWVAPRPYFRPAWDAAIGRAIQASKDRMAEKIAEFSGGIDRL